MKKRFTFIKTLLVAVLLGVGANAWAADKTVVKYSFDNATSPSLTAGSRVSFDYDKTSVITSTNFLNAYNNANGDPGASTLSLGSTDLSGETWTLSFEWAACGGCNSKPDHTTLKAGDATLFDLSGNSNWNTTVTISYTGSDGSKTLPVPGCNKSYRFSAATGNQLNTTDYWHHIVVTGSASGVKMTITNSNTGTAVVEDVVLSETNVNPTSLILEPCCGGAIGLDELSLTYFVEGEVIQTPTASYTAVNGIERTITATCETEGATIQHSTDGVAYEDGASVTVSESGNVYFKAVKGTSESDVLTFAAVAGEAITLNAPTINRSDNTTVTITADQTNLLLSPTATIYYEYGAEKGEFTGSKVLTVAADATITAYAEATGYTKSATSERAVAIFPTNIETIENTPTKTSGWSANTFSTETKTVSERTYAALLLDEAQWGTNVYLQTDGAWGVRSNGSWYVNATTASWILMPNMKAGDIIVADVNYAASEMVNATYSKYSYGNRFAYEVTDDGDVELAFNKINGSTMDYFYGIYAYTAGTCTATFENTAGWTDVYAYTFNDKTLGGWPGTKLEATDGVYNVEFKTYSAPKNIIFHNDAGTQTSDLPFINGYKYTTDDIYTVAGTENLLGTNWDVTNESNVMKNNGDGTYSLTFTGVTLSENAEYKVVKNQTWGSGSEWPSSNQVIGINMADKYDITINFNPSTGAVSETMSLYQDITEAGFATLYTPYDLDFSGVEGLTAYIATLSGKTVELAPVTSVKAGTGVVLKGAANTYKIPMVESSATDEGDLKGSATEATTADGTQYILALNGEGKAQFTKASSGSTIAAGKAYLVVADGARDLTVVFGDQTTGISAASMNKTMNNEVYNLNGQRVAKAQKGLYIVNGKKVIFK